MGSKTIERILEIYRISRPILLVLVLAALIVFINSYPNVPEIADETKDYRQQVKSKFDLNASEQKSFIIKSPESPSLPNTITPFISPEDVEELTQPKPSPQPKPNVTGNETPGETLETTTDKEPTLEIKLLTGFLNVAPLIIIAALGGFGIYLLFKYKKHLTLRSMFGSAIAVVAICTIIFFGIIMFYFLDYLYNFNWDLEFLTWGIIPLAVPFGIWLSYNIISSRTTRFRRNVGLAIAGALMGSFLAAFLPFWIVFILLIGITLFDIYSVKFGPIKKIMELDENNKKNNKKQNEPQELKKEKVIIYRTIDSSSKKDKNIKVITIEKKEKIEEDKSYGKTELEMAEPTKAHTWKISNPKKSIKKSGDEFDLMLMFDNPDWSLGLGDFVIYSMFTSAVLTYCLLYLPYYIFYTPALGLILPWIIFFLCSIGLLIGFFITLRLLKKRDYLPGLPISIGCGFAVFIICIIILQLINYLLFNEFAIIF